MNTMSEGLLDIATPSKYHTQIEEAGSIMLSSHFCQRPIGEYTMLGLVVRSWLAFCTTGSIHFWSCRRRLSIFVWGNSNSFKQAASSSSSSTRELNDTQRFLVLRFVSSAAIYRPISKFVRVIDRFDFTRGRLPSSRYLPRARHHEHSLGEQQANLQQFLGQRKDISFHLHCSPQYCDVCR